MTKQAREQAELAKIENFPISPAGLYRYLRVSTRVQKDGDGFRRQRQTIIEYANKKGFDASQIVFFQDAASAYHNLHFSNGNFGLFLKAVKRWGRLERRGYLFFEAFDRFGRNRNTLDLYLNTLLALNRANIGVHFIVEEDDSFGPEPGLTF